MRPLVYLDIGAIRSEGQSRRNPFNSRDTPRSIISNLNSRSSALSPPQETTSLATLQATTEIHHNGGTMSFSPSPSNDDPNLDRAVPNSNSDSDSLSHSPTRPNRWVGAPSTWASLTFQERGLAASLDTLQDADLSIHLYNAYNLKKRAHDVRNGRVKVEEEFAHLPEEDRIWEPPRYWTAWPLRPEDVPREGEKVGPEDKDEAYTFRRAEYEMEMPSGVLEEVLVGTTLRIAKENFMAREEAGAHEEITMFVAHEDEEVSVENGEAGAGAEEGGSAGELPESGQRQEELLEPFIKEASEPPQLEKLLKPVVSADDDRSRELLRPSIRHTLSKLDEMLMALHHARRTCLQYSLLEESIDEDTPVETSAAEESTSTVKRPKGRPRKFANLTDRSKSQAAPIDEADLFRAKKTHLGRPQKVYERLEGESQHEYLIRIARIQKKPLPAFAPPRETPETPEPRRTGKSPARIATEEEKEQARKRRIRPRDWSEVLGAAALVGFPPDVIARATQRCANLFGESMIMRSIVERPFSVKDSDVLTHYRPQAIPDFGDEETTESSESYVDDSSSQSDAWGKKRKAKSKRPFQLGQAPLKQTCFCPIQDCPRKTRGFNGIGKLKRHLRRGHQIPNDKLDDYILPSDEEMDGAVHVDGFLKPLKYRGGTRGKYKKEEKRSREGSEEEEDEEHVGEAEAPGPGNLNGEHSADE